MEIGELGLRYNHVTELPNDEALCTILDMVKERKGVSFNAMAAQKQRIKRYYN